MKKTFILPTFIALLFLFPVAASAQTKPLFPFGKSQTATVTPAPVEPSQPAPTEIVDETLGLTDLKDLSLSERRKVVSGELDAILLRLNVLYDKTKVATTRLTQNGIETEKSHAALAQAALSLAQARLTINALTLSAFDPTAEGSVLLMVDGVPFKDSVIKAEAELRSARSFIIASLTELKAAVNTAISASAE